ncbi:class F sortase [Acidithrix ferrooxidans]|uniref:Sortase family protein n=2 Tax=Acidithrix TaxID=1609233 RepID=A0A0D8HCG2_9ACTN|nr:class F sortase [Acidithrix ferrooxidans]KJF15618.1 sortase family protein [Acidithrix ferrooxidans]
MAKQSRSAHRISQNKNSFRQWIWWGIATVAMTIGVVSLVGTLPTRDPIKVVIAKAVAPRPQRVASKFATIPSARPVQLTIPAIGINTYVGTLGLQANHQVMVPTNSHTVGWFIYGPTPGQIGSSVILGHVDSYLGPGIFFNLKSLVAGDTITLVLADGTVTNFEVTKVVQYAKASFPDQLVYGSNGTRSLQLVTCGGTFDHATGSYESNIVVFSQLVSASLPKL